MTWDVHPVDICPMEGRGMRELEADPGPREEDAGNPGGSSCACLDGVGRRPTVGDREPWNVDAARPSASICIRGEARTEGRGRPEVAGPEMANLSPGDPVRSVLGDSLSRARFAGGSSIVADNFELRPPRRMGMLLLRWEFLGRSTIHRPR